MFNISLIMNVYQMNMDRRFIISTSIRIRRLLNLIVNNNIRITWYLFLKFNFGNFLVVIFKTIKNILINKETMNRYM